MKIFKRILVLFLVVVGVVVFLNYPKLNIISGYASKYTASSVLVGRHSPDSILANDLDMPLVKLATTTYSLKKPQHLLVYMD